MSRVLALFLSLLACLSCGIATAAPPNTLLARGRTEPSLAVDPRDPSHVVAVTNTNYAAPVGDTYPLAIFRSRNAGVSFAGGLIPIIRPYIVQADPTVILDHRGTVFLSFLGETAGYCDTGHSAVFVTHSIDGGRSFRGATIVDTAGADDKPNLAVLPLPGRPSQLFVSWTRFHVGANSSDIWFARSLDGGAHFSRPYRIYSSRGDNLASVPVVAGDGRVYVFWDHFVDRPDEQAGRSQMFLRASQDLGGHFAPLQKAGPPFEQIPLVLQPDALRNLTMPAVSIDMHGTLLLARPEEQQLAGKHVADIILRRSTDGGKHWSQGIVINSSRNGNRFMPAVTAFSGGDAVVAFYDQRRRGNLDVYAARVHFGNRITVGRNVRLDAGTSPPADVQYIPPSATCFIPGRFFGDYVGLAVSGRDSICVAWTDTQLHIQNETDVWFARLRLSPAAP